MPRPYLPHLQVVLQVSIPVAGNVDAALSDELSQGLKESLATNAAGQWLGSDIDSCDKAEPKMTHCLDTTPENEHKALLVVVAVLTRHDAAMRATVRRFFHRDDGSIEESVVLNPVPVRRNQCGCCPMTTTSAQDPSLRWCGRPGCNYFTCAKHRCHHQLETSR